MALIGIDLDDTLYSFCAAARKELASWEGPEAAKFRTAAYAIWTDWRSADDLCGGEFIKVIDRVHMDESILSQEPYDGAVETVQELDEAGHELLYISSRAPKCARATRDWLHMCGFPQSRHLICTYEDKIPHLGDAQYIIDDRPKTLVSFVYNYDWAHAHGPVERLGFGLHVTQNLSLTDVPRVYLAPTWHLLRHYLEEKAELL